MTDGNMELNFYACKASKLDTDGIDKILGYWDVTEEKVTAFKAALTDTIAGLVVFADTPLGAAGNSATVYIAVTDVDSTGQVIVVTDWMALYKEEYGEVIENLRTHVLTVDADIRSQIAEAGEDE